MAGYAIGLTAEPNLYSSIYANKQARADADAAKKAQEQSEKYAKDADKFRVDYSKIHPIHAAEAKGTVSEFMQKANELREKYPNTYANTEEYNKAFFDATAKLEDLTGSSKVIYDEQKLRLEHPDKFETNPQIMDALAKVDTNAVNSLLGRNRFQPGDIAMEKWNEQQAAKDIIAKTAQDEVLKKDANGDVITTPVKGGTEDVYMTAVKTLNSPQLQKNTLDMWQNNPAMQRKFKTEQEALDWSKGFAEQGTKEITSAIYHAPASASGIGTKWNGNIGTSNTGTYIFNPNGVSRSGEVDVKTETALKQVYDKALAANQAAIKYATDNDLDKPKPLPSFDAYKKTIADKLPKTNNPTVVLQYKGATDNPIRGFVGKNGESINGSPKFFEFVDNEWVLNVDEKNPLTDKLETKKIPLLDDKGVNLDNIQADYGELDLGKFDVKGQREVIKTNPYPQQNAGKTYTYKGSNAALKGKVLTEAQIAKFKIPQTDYE